MDKVKLGARIAAAREAAQMTQADLARGIGIDRSALSRLEGGTRRLEVSELLSLCEALDLPLASLVSEEPASVISRRRDSLTDTVSTWPLEAQLHLLARDVREFQRLGLLEDPLPRPEFRTPRSHDEAERIAGAVRRLLGIPSGPLADLGRHCERLGLHASVTDTVVHDGAFVSVDGTAPELGVAVLGGASGPGRRRMTLAHELGHWLFGDAYDHGAAWEESMIFSFAIHLLAPRESLTVAWSSHPQRSVRQRALLIACDFRLSWSAAVNQLRTLGLVTDSEWDALRRQNPRRGEFLRLGVTITEELRAPYLSPGFVASVLQGYTSGRLTAERTVESLRGIIGPADLPPQDPMDLSELTRAFLAHGG